MSEKKLVRVELEYDDGEVMRLTGDVAQEWIEEVNGQIAIGRVHGVDFPVFDFETVRPTNAKMAENIKTIEERIEALTRRPARWDLPGRSYSGPGGRIVNVFYTETSEEQALLRGLGSELGRLDELAGGPLIYIFHDTESTERLYSEIKPLPDGEAQP